ncbi:MAG: hypothetical protein ABI723_20660 [Bacteroidia bacterium]
MKLKINIAIRIEYYADSPYPRPLSEGEGGENHNVELNISNGSMLDKWENFPRLFPSP